MLVVKLQKWGNSYGIRIPKSILEVLDWDVHQEISLEAKGRSLMLHPIKRGVAPILRPRVWDDFETEGDTAQECNLGHPQGKEVM